MDELHAVYDLGCLQGPDMEPSLPTETRDCNFRMNVICEQQIS